MKSDTVPTLCLSICHEEIGSDAMILVFWILSFKPIFEYWVLRFFHSLLSPSSRSSLVLLHFLSLKWYHQHWICFGRTDAEAEAPILWPTQCKKLTHWKRPWCWGKLRARGDRGDDWVISLTQWTWAWAKSGRLWWTEKPGVLQFVRSQRDRHDLVTEQ